MDNQPIIISGSNVTGRHYRLVGSEISAMKSLKYINLTPLRLFDYEHRTRRCSSCLSIKRTCYRQNISRGKKRCQKYKLTFKLPPTSYFQILLSQKYISMLLRNHSVENRTRLWQKPIILERSFIHLLSF